MAARSRQLFNEDPFDFTTDWFTCPSGKQWQIVQFSIRVLVMPVAPNNTLNPFILSPSGDSHLAENTFTGGGAGGTQFAIDRFRGAILEALDVIKIGGSNSSSRARAFLTVVERDA